MDASDPPACSSCAPKLALSVEEERVLRRMRGLREEYRALRDAGGDAERIEELRRRFRECQQELREANRLKMLRLGHEP